MQCHRETCLRRYAACQQFDVVSAGAYAYSDRGLSVVCLGYEHNLCYYCRMVSRCLVTRLAHAHCSRWLPRTIDRVNGTHFLF